jgi:hypothetical protein
MTHPRLSFGELTVTGELARGLQPTDELGLQMAMALGQPADPWPAAAIVPVLLDNSCIGELQRIDFVWGGQLYQFRLLSGNTNFSCGTKEGALQHLAELLQLTS